MGTAVRPQPAGVLATAPPTPSSMVASMAADVTVASRAIRERDTRSFLLEPLEAAPPLPVRMACEPSPKALSVEASQTAGRESSEGTTTHRFRCVDATTGARRRGAVGDARSQL